MITEGQGRIQARTLVTHLLINFAKLCFNPSLIVRGGGRVELCDISQYVAGRGPNIGLGGAQIAIFYLI